MATWADVTQLMKTLPLVEKLPGRREWRIKKKLLGWERPLRNADKKELGDDAPDGPIFAVNVPLDIKDMLLASKSRIYFTTTHFDGWPAILVRLPEISVGELQEVIHRSWFELAPGTPGGKSELLKQPRRARRSGS